MNDYQNGNGYKNIVCIGGGTGQASLLRGFKRFPNISLTGIVGVTDNGGFSGVIRQAMNIPQPGDSRNCIEALSDKDNMFSKLLAYRFEEGTLAGTSLGNLMIAALTRITGDFAAAIKETCALSGAPGRVLPITNESTNICAELVDGTHVEGEWEIIRRQPRSKIKKLYLQHKVNAYTDAVRAIKNADLIVICPGSLATGIISCLLVDGINDAISESKGKLVYVCNIMTHPGQTDDFKASDHVREIQKYIKRKIDVVLVNEGIPEKEILKIYEMDGAYTVQNDTEKLSEMRVISDDLLYRGEIPDRTKGKDMKAFPHLIRHNSEKTTRILISLI